MMIQLIQLILGLVGKGDTEKNHPAYGLIAHVYVNTYVTSARMYVTSECPCLSMVGVSMRRGIHYWNLRICKLHVINCNFVSDYCNIFVTNVAAAPGYGWSRPLITYPVYGWSRPLITYPVYGWSRPLITYPVYSVISIFMSDFIDI